MFQTVSKYNYLVKGLLVGDTKVGKTILLNHMAGSINSWDPSNQSPETIGIDFKIKCHTLDSGKVAKAQLWDTAGELRFRSISPAYLRGSHVIYIVHRETDDISWYQKVIKGHCNEDVTVYDVTTYLGPLPDPNVSQGLCDSNNHFKYYVSLTDGSGIGELFHDSMEKVCSKMKPIGTTISSYIEKKEDDDEDDEEEDEDEEDVEVEEPYIIPDFWSGVVTGFLSCATLFLLKNYW